MIKAQCQLLELTNLYLGQSKTLMCSELARTKLHGNYRKAGDVNENLQNISDYEYFFGC